MNVDWLAEMKPRQRRRFEDDGPVVMLSEAERDVLVSDFNAHASELVAVRSALRSLVAIHPGAESGYDGEFWACHYCKAFNEVVGSDEVLHADSCPWVAARVLLDGLSETPEAS